MRRGFALILVTVVSDAGWRYGVSGLGTVFTMGRITVMWRCQMIILERGFLSLMFLSLSLLEPSRLGLLWFCIALGNYILFLRAVHHEMDRIS
jgi:hypothetical protein